MNGFLSNIKIYTFPILDNFRNRLKQRKSEVLISTLTVNVHKPAYKQPIWTHGGSVCRNIIRIEYPESLAFECIINLNVI